MLHVTIYIYLYSMDLYFVPMKKYLVTTEELQNKCNIIKNASKINIYIIKTRFQQIYIYIHITLK